MTKQPKMIWRGSGSCALGEKEIAQSARLKCQPSFAMFQRHFAYSDLLEQVFVLKPIERMGPSWGPSACLQASGIGQAAAGIDAAQALLVVVDSILLVAVDSDFAATMFLAFAAEKSPLAVAAVQLG